MNSNPTNYLNKIKSIIPTLIPSEPDYVQNVFGRSFSLISRRYVIEYVEYGASNLGLDITRNPTDQELIGYVKWCWRYHQKKSEMDNILLEIKHNPPNDKCFR